MYLNEGIQIYYRMTYSAVRLLRVSIFFNDVCAARNPHVALLELLQIDDKNQAPQCQLEIVGPARQRCL